MIADLLKNKGDKTVFTIADIGNILGKPVGENLISNVNYYVKKEDLLSISKGLYALDQSFNKLELANKLRRPSYISFYTVLQAKGVVFQEYNSIFCASTRSEKIDKFDTTYVYRKLKDDIVLNPVGINIGEQYSIASAERALCDKLYLDGEEYFDNLEEIDWNKVDELLETVYKSKSLNNTIKKLKNAK